MAFVVFLARSWVVYLLGGTLVLQTFRLRGPWLAAIVMVTLAKTVSTAQAELPPLISREILFSNPERTEPKLSPDGKRLAWLAPDSKNVLQIWVQSIGDSDERMVTADKKRGIHRYEWAQNSEMLLYLQDADGDENWHLYGVELATDKARDFTPQRGVQARITALDPNFPDEALISLNERDSRVHDVYRLNVKSGSLHLDTENPGDVADFGADAQFQVRLAHIMTPDGGTELRVRNDAVSEWRSWMKVELEDILTFISFTADGKSAYLLSSIGRDTGQVVERDIRTGKETVIAGSDQVDAFEVMTHPRRHIVQAVSFMPGRREWTVVDPLVKADFEAITKLDNGDFRIVSRDNGDVSWVIAFVSDRKPGRYYLWNRRAKTGRFLFSEHPKLQKLSFADVEPVVIESRDGLKLHGYLTRPVHVPAKRLPLVLLVHGGPWGRDVWGFDPTVQWLANRGYAVLQVNFRGSTGYGKRLLNAGNKQWGRKMHDDLINAVTWAVRGGYADPKRVAIMGTSYGGYASLAGVAFTPDVFACAVDVVGPSNLRTLVASLPAYWKPTRSWLDARLGNIDDPNDARLMREASPLYRADKIIRPLLIGHGANDPRVKQAESEQIVAAIRGNHGNVTYVLYSDEGHGFVRPENQIDFNARAEAFLAQNLGGRVEPMVGTKYPGSTAVVEAVGK
jgi:dipeptidyl aminopeptidase/acylaminoacyl peptidase